MKRFLLWACMVVVSCGSDAAPGPGSNGAAGSAGATSAAGSTSTAGTTSTAGAAGTAMSGGSSGAAGSQAAAGSGGVPSAGEAGAGGTGDEAGAGGSVDDESGPASRVGFDWGKAVIETRLADKPTFGGSYTDGLALRGIYLAYLRSKEAKYLSVLTAAADAYTVPGGSNLDELMHMVAVVDAYALAPVASFATKAQQTRAKYEGYPMSDGVFWHAKGESRRQQLWADGVFMSLAFLTRYGAVFDDASIWPLASTQLLNTAKHLHNPATGLLWHAWDESGDATWSKHPSQTNEIHWGRAMGWFGLASVMTLEALPESSDKRAPIEQILKTLVENLAKYQDPVTGRWYQVVDLPADDRNWLETSCSSMFTYVTWWAYKHKLVGSEYAEVARKGFDGVLQQISKDANDRTKLVETCVGLNASDDLVGNYFNHGRADNDPHGVGAFLLMWEGMQ